MKAFSISDNWKFFADTSNDFSDENIVWSDIDVPHDFQIYHVNNLYTDCMLYYKKALDIRPLKDKRYFLYFEGVYMDTSIFVNEKYVFEWKNGYSSFYFDITDFLKDDKNEILVKCKVKHPNSRWYSGAGIYRDVWLWEMPNVYIKPQSIYISSRKNENGWNVSAEAKINLAQNVNIDNYSVLFSLKDKDNVIDTKTLKLNAFEMKDNIINCKIDFFVENPMLWQLDNPYIYNIEVNILENNRIIDSDNSDFGFRSIKFTSNDGFYLNDKRIVLHGVCMHHDLGCLGAAFNLSAAERQLKIMKNMGANAIRTAHNMPAEGIIKIADRLGMLVIDEAFDMWRSPKTDYDYARFFDDWYKKDIKSFVMRDRNHPSVIMWSIGNEIYDTHSSSEGLKTMMLLTEEVKKYDKNSNACITIGSNYMPWENTQKCADVIKLIGYNYGEKYYKEHHKMHPDWIIYGSETASIVQSRGIYHFPLEKSLLVDEDLQCSSLGNSRTSWGAENVDYCLNADKNNNFSLGQFIWSGFDYIGEPTPYHTKNSYFGQVDTAGFEKDSYYQYMACWKDGQQTVLHMLPYWDFNNGQNIDVCVYSNAHSVELFLNGKSQGRKFLNKSKTYMLNWKLKYEKGCIKAAAYDKDGNILCEKEKNSFGDAVKLKIQCDKSVFKDKELAFLKITALDKNNTEVENANNYITVLSSENANILGLDNGDSTDFSEYKTNIKQMFSGKLLAVVSGSGKCKIKVCSFGLISDEIELDFGENKALSCEINYSEDIKDYIPIRKIELSSQNTNLTKENNRTLVTARIYPENANKSELKWFITNSAGVVVPNASIKVNDDNTAEITGIGNGDIMVRCMCNNDRNHVQIISQLEFNISGMGELNLNPYNFISGSLYTKSYGDIGNGNERGVSMSRTGESWVAFENLDFGRFGSDKVNIPIFELAGEPTEICFWNGIPHEEKSEIIGKKIYHKPKMWNVYQNEDFELDKKLVGLQTFSIELKSKIHIKGFNFEKPTAKDKKINAGEYDMIYGDSYQKNDTAVYSIGNNVSLVFKQLDFGEKPIKGIKICGKTQLNKNTIHICFENGQGSKRQIVEFNKCSEFGEQIFMLDSVSGINDITFLFLPGSKFDFQSFMFF